MARASTVTWLSLDRWAQIMGLHPAKWNGVYSATFPLNSACDDIFYQYAWQSADKVAREDIAQAIHDAEQQIAQYVGYHLVPEWRCDERRLAERPHVPNLFNVYGTNERFTSKTVVTDRAWFISGGQKTKTLIDDDVTGTTSDADGDGYAETVTFSVATTIDPCEVHMYHRGYSGADAWEVRPITIVDSGVTLSVTCKIWQLVDPGLWESMAATGIDGDTVANFQQCSAPVAAICADFYRVYNDESTQVEFHWLDPQCSTCGGTGCDACEYGAQDGCLHARDYRLGTVAYSPATWNSTTGVFDADSWAECREPDRMRLWYYSGFKSDCVTCPEKDMDPALERAVAYFAASLLDRALCTCENAQRFAEHWREDLAMATAGRSYQNAAKVLENPLGTTRGAVYAWNVINQEGRRIPRVAG